MIKPFSVARRARAYFLIAFAFWVLSATLPIPFAAIPSADQQWWQTLVAKGVGSLDKISFFVALSGLLYAVLSDALDYIWSSNLKDELETGFRQTGSILTNSLADFTSGLVGMSFESVKVWIENGRGTKEQIKTLTGAALVNSYGKHNEDKDSLIEFVLDAVLGKWALEELQIFENYVTSTTIRSCGIANHFEWEERRTYTVLCLANTGSIPLRLEGSAQVEVGQLKHAIDQMDISVRFGIDTIFNFRQWWIKHKVDYSSGKFRAEGDQAIFEYDGIWLTYTMAYDCVSKSQRTDVSIYEKSYVSTDDRCYSLALRHPTKGLRSSLSIEGLPNWIVKQAVASSELYNSGTRTVQIDRNHPKTCSVTASGWTLPGVAVVIEWSPVKP